MTELETGEFRAFLYGLLLEVEAELREEEVAREQCAELEAEYDETADIEEEAE